MEDKVSAIYSLREAAERHALIAAEVQGGSGGASSRQRLLDARLELEKKTHDAIEACVYCGRQHTDDDEDCRPEAAR